jgi:hypothetical protein
MMKRMQGGNGRRRDRDNSNRSRSGNNNTKRGYFGGNLGSQNDPQYDRRMRAKALQNIDKYAQMARDALSNGDYVLAEHYYQHGDHYYRVAASFGDIPQTQNFSGDMEAVADTGAQTATTQIEEDSHATNHFVAEETRPQERFQRDNHRSFEPREHNRQRYQQQQPDAHFPARHAEQEGDVPREDRAPREGRDNRDNNGQQRFRPYNNRRPQQSGNRSFQPRDGEQPQRVAPQSAEKIDAAFLFGALPVAAPVATLAPAPVVAFAPEGGIVTAPKRRGRPPRVKVEDAGE